MTINDDSTYDRIIDELAYRYEDTFSRDEVASQVRSSRSELGATSRHPEFLPVFVEKHAREHLLASARTDGRLAKAMPEVLFICVHNEGRSQMAAAFAEHLSGGHIHVRSAGSHPTGSLNPLVVEALRERDITLERAYPTALTGDILRAADVVVRMGCDLPQAAGRQYLDWEVPDPHHQSLATVRQIRDDIEARVVQLLLDLDVPVRQEFLPTTSTELREKGRLRVHLPRIKVGHA